MYWTLELASKLEDAPWPATKDELIDYAMRSGAPLEVIENLQEMEDEGEIYESIEDIWPDYPSKEDFFFNKFDSVRNNRTVDERTPEIGASVIFFRHYVYSSPTNNGSSGLRDHKQDLRSCYRSVQLLQ